jgi:putative ABC transport system permease protein
MNIILKIAWRNIWRNKVRSIIIMLSIAIGIFSGIMVLALYKGMMRSRVKTVVYAEIGHLQIHDTNFKKDYEPIYTIAYGDSIVRQIKKLPEVKAVATRTITMGMLSTTTGSAGIQINGINVTDEKRVSMLDRKIEYAILFDSIKSNEILISRKLANKLKLELGNKLVLTFTDIENNLVSSAFRVKSIYASDNAPLDERNVFIQEQSLNQLIGIGHQFHEIAIILHKDESLDNMQKMLQQEFPNHLVESWKTISPETDLMVYTVDISSYIIMGIILFALAFGIINTMLMAVLERTREIGMMMALGMNRLKLFFLILFETFFLTIAGLPIGILTGWTVAAYYHIHGMDWLGRGKEMMNSFGFNTTIYPEFPTEKLNMTIGFVLFTALIACIYPAIKALKLRPVDALRK